MRGSKIKTAGVFLSGLIFSGVLFLPSGFAVNKSAGYYAGPLSAAGEDAVKEYNPDIEADEPERMDEDVQRARDVSKGNSLPRGKEKNNESPLSAVSG